MAVVTIDGLRVPTRVYDISASGAQMARVPGVQLGVQCKLDLPGYGMVLASVVRAEPDSFAVIFTPNPDLQTFMDSPEAVFERLCVQAD